MEVYSLACPLVWGLLGAYWIDSASLKKVLGRSYASLLDLQTIIVEVEAILNDQPITYVSSDLKDPEPLTPAHLLYRRTVVSLPHPLTQGDEVCDPDYGMEDNEVKKRAKTRTLFLNHFWRRWRTEYLISLREFHPTTGNNAQLIKKGDIVLVHNDGPRAYWKLTVTEDVIVGHDGLFRAVSICTSSGRTNRPVSRLYPLEITSKTDPDLELVGSDTTPNQDSPQTTRDVPPTRQAAMKARAGWTE